MVAQWLRLHSPNAGRGPGFNPWLVNQILHATTKTQGSQINTQIFLKIKSTMKRGEVKSLSRVQLFATPWTVAYQAPLSMGFSRQEYWSGLPLPSLEDLPHPGIEPRSPAV